MTTSPTEILDIREHARRAPDRVAIVCGNTRMSYGELDALANRFAHVFRSHGLLRGDHIASLCGNRPEALAITWAAWRTGLYLTPMPTSLTVSELQYLVADCDARLVIADASLVTAARQLPALLPSAICWCSLGGTFDGFAPIEPLLDAASPMPHAQEPPGAIMMYTSGTTGKPKGVVRPLLPTEWRGTPPFASDLIALFGVGGEDVRYLSTAPLYHAAPLRVALAVSAGGGTAYILDSFDASTALRLLATEAITHSQWVPTMFQRLLALPEAERRAYHAPRHRTAIHGAAPCPPSVKRAMIDWWGPILLEYYSGSEGAGLTLIDSDEALQRPGSVGRARKGVLHIVGADGGDLPPGATGLVCFSGVAPFAYHKAPEKTSGRTLAGGRQTFGDIGHVDDDGYLYLTDRQDDMIISGGVNVYPQEIEAVIRDVPGIWDCAVVGIPDERFGERPIAFVVADRSHAISAEAVTTSVADRCSQKLGRFKQPKAIYVIDELPYSATGKILRRQLRARSTGG